MKRFVSLQTWGSVIQDHMLYFGCSQSILLDHKTRELLLLKFDVCNFLLGHVLLFFFFVVAVWHSSSKICTDQTQTYYSEGRDIDITFVSDSSTERSGFQIAYCAVTDDEVCHVVEHLWGSVMRNHTQKQQTFGRSKHSFFLNITNNKNCH